MANKTEEAVTEEVVTEKVQGPSITAGDLSTLVKLIDAGSQRGAWRGDELSTIGAIREKLVTIVNAIAPAAEEEATEEAAEAAEEAVEEEITETVVEKAPVEEVVSTDADESDAA